MFHLRAAGLGLRNIVAGSKHLNGISNTFATAAAGVAAAGETPVYSRTVLKTLQRTKFNPKTVVWKRSDIVGEELVGKTVLIHNGRTQNAQKCTITQYKIGMKFGCFAGTRTFRHKKVEKKEIKKKKDAK